MMAWNGSSHAQNVMLLRNEVESGGANGDTTSLVAMLSSGLRGLDQRQEQSGGGPKRPFYAMFDGLDDTGDGEVADDSAAHVEKKRRLTVEQVRSLEMSFEVENRLEPVRKMQLAQELGLQPRQVAVWFQNRRARWKTKQLERDYDILKAAYESLAEENKKLKAQLERLIKADGKEEEEEEEVEEPAAATAVLLEDVLQHPKSTEIEEAASGGDDVCTPDSPTVVSSKFKAKEESPISDGYNSEVMDAFSPHAAAVATTASAVTKPVAPPQGVENCHEQQQHQAPAAPAAAPAAAVKEEPYGVDSFPQMNYRLEDSSAGLLLEEPPYTCFFAVPEEEQESWSWWDWS